MPNEYETRLEREIWGCVKYIGIPYETVMKMPIYKRKDYIRLHNEEQEGIARQHNKDSSKSTVSGMMINDYAKLEQANKDNRNY